MEQGYFSFTLNGTEKIDHSCAKNNNNLDIELTYFTKINPKWIMDLNVKLSEDKIEKLMSLDITPKARSRKENIDKLVLFKVKSAQRKILLRE